MACFERRPYFALTSDLIFITDSGRVYPVFLIELNSPLLVNPTKRIIVSIFHCCECIYYHTYTKFNKSASTCNHHSTFFISVMILFRTLRIVDWSIDE